MENAAVGEFLRWPDAWTQDFLLGLSRRRMLSGLAEVFGKMRLAAAVPYLDRALEDNVCRQAAGEALVAIGAAARRALALSAATPLPADDAETASSLRRRRSALGVLALIGMESEDWPALRLLLEED